MANVLVNENTMGAIAAAIRQKTGTMDTMKPREMPAKILNISGGSGGGMEIVGGTFDLFRAGWDDNYLAQAAFRFKECTGAGSMFEGNTEIVEPEIILELFNSQHEIDGNTHGVSFNRMFYGCTNLKSVEKIYLLNWHVRDVSYMFYNCQSLKEVPEDWLPDNSLRRDPAFGYASADPPIMGYCFYRCYKLRHINNFYKDASNITYKDTVTYLPTYYNLYDCVALEEVLDFPTFTTSTTFSSTPFTGFLNRPHNLRRFTFKPGGTLKRSGTATFTLSLSGYCGYFNTSYDFSDWRLMYTNAVPDAKVIDSDETYALYKDDPDAVAVSPAYSFFGHDSAKELIDSLPTIVNSGTGTTVLKLSGGNGANTDQGAINTLTEEEIAGAIEKGWTITIS